MSLAPDRPPTTQNQPLLERGSDLAALRAVIDAARAGSGGLVLVEGPPGIGKSRLLGEASAHAYTAGMRVLRARGAEFEREFSYGVVRQLFEPALVSAPGERRSELLAGAASLAAPLFDIASLVRQDVASDASFALLHGLYWLTLNLATARPLLLVVDDVQWCDSPSLRFLAYLERRIEGLPVAVAAAARPSEPGEDMLLAELAGDPLATLVRPAPLSPAAAAELVRGLVSEEAADEFCSACYEQSGGNPLLLREIVSTVVAEGLQPTAASALRVGQLAARGVARSVLLRLSRLDPAAVALARACAVLGDDVPLRLASALAELEPHQASAAASALAAVDILEPGTPLRFAHPVVRSAVYSELPLHEREAAHVRAAELLRAAGAPAEQAAAHALAVAPARRDWVVSVLREAGRGALAAGAGDIAVAYLRRALEEPPTAEQRVGVLSELGAAELLISGGDAVSHLQEALELTHDPLARGWLALATGDALLYIGRLKDAYAVYRRGLADAPEDERDLRQRLEAGLRLQVMEPTTYPAALSELEAMRQTPPDETLGGRTKLAMLAFHDARAGTADAEVSVARAQEALANGVLLERDNGGGALVLSATVMALADRDEALEVLDQSLAEAHRHGSIFAFAAAKVFRAHAYLVRGALAEAAADARDAIEACASWGIDLGRGYPAAFLAEALLACGDLAAAAAALDEACRPDAVPHNGHWHWYLQARAHLLAARGDARAALAATMEAREQFEQVCGRNPAFMPWRSDAALLLLTLDDAAEARRLAAEEVELARAWGAPRALGRALRVHGLVRGGAPGLRLLEEAAQVLRPSPARLELATALVDLGAALRRGNRRSDSREPLRAGLELASVCGARPLAERARTELAATGARPRSVMLSGPDSLTPSERRVATMAAEGMANRDIAQALFVTPKTVEVHLSSSYRKLGIASRGELRAALAGGSAD